MAEPREDLSLFSRVGVTRPRSAERKDRRRASDGEWARTSGDWAPEKLSYLENFMEIFTTGMSNRWNGRLAYIDLMSGPGMCVTPSGLEFLGSPLRALQTRKPFNAAVFVERDATLADALRKRVGQAGLRPRPIIMQDDCNSPSVVAEIRRLTEGCLTLVFVDLLGFNVKFRTIQALTESRSMDLVITFPEQDIARNFGLAFPRKDTRWDEFFGTDRWREVIRRYRQQHRYSGKPIRLLLLEFYKQRLQALGYEVDLGVASMKNTRRVPLYRPVFASKHPRGLDFWNKAKHCGKYREQPLF